MLLTIYNLPKHLQYKEIKALIQSKCGVSDIILDLMENNGSGLREVKLGLPTEEDAAMVMRKINGMYIDGNHIRIEHLRSNKTSEVPLRIRKEPSYIQNQYPLLNQLQIQPQGRQPSGLGLVDPQTNLPLNIYMPVTYVPTPPNMPVSASYDEQHQVQYPPQVIYQTPMDHLQQDILGFKSEGHHVACTSNAQLEIDVKPKISSLDRDDSDRYWSSERDQRYRDDIKRSWSSERDQRNLDAKSRWSPERDQRYRDDRQRYWSPESNRSRDKRSRSSERDQRDNKSKFPRRGVENYSFKRGARRSVSPPRHRTAYSNRDEHSRNSKCDYDKLYCKKERTRSPKRSVNSNASKNLKRESKYSFQRYHETEHGSYHTISGIKKQYRIIKPRSNVNYDKPWKKLKPGYPQSNNRSENNKPKQKPYLQEKLDKPKHFDNSGVRYYGNKGVMWRAQISASFAREMLSDIPYKPDINSDILYNELKRVIRSRLATLGQEDTRPKEMVILFRAKYKKKFDEAILIEAVEKAKIIEEQMKAEAEVEMKDDEILTLLQKPELGTVQLSKKIQKVQNKNGDEKLTKYSEEEDAVAIRCSTPQDEKKTSRLKLNPFSRIKNSPITYINIDDSILETGRPIPYVNLDDDANETEIKEETRAEDEITAQADTADINDLITSQHKNNIENEGKEDAFSNDNEQELQNNHDTDVRVIVEPDVDNDATDNVKEHIIDLDKLDDNMSYDDFIIYKDTKGDFGEIESYEVKDSDGGDYDQNIGDGLEESEREKYELKRVERDDELEVMEDETNVNVDDIEIGDIDESDLEDY